MPITYVTAVIGSLALAGIPPFAGFFSKDSIIEAVALSNVGGHTYAYWAVLIGVFVTAFYSFRMLVLAFHGAPRFDTHDPGHAVPHAAAGRIGEHDQGHEAGAEPAHDEHGPPKESPWVVTVPLILLAIPSVYAGWTYIEPMLFGDWFGGSIVVREGHDVLRELRGEWHGVVPFMLHGLASPTFWLAVAGIAAAAYCYLVNPAVPARIAALARWIALVGAVAGFVVTIPLYTQFDAATSAMQFVELREWIPRFDIRYHLGVDGISVLFVLLNSFTTVLVVWAGWEVIKVRVSQYMAAFLIMSGLINGVFAALDGVLFYMFFEAMLIPMYIIIGVWGGPNRVYAALKFFLYTLLGSLLMLIALLYLYNVSESFSIQ
jgi:NADH:ubiquinone oxidoreductase subunit 4 (subunit M)